MYTRDTKVTIRGLIVAATTIWIALLASLIPVNLLFFVLALTDENVILLTSWQIVYVGVLVHALWIVWRRALAWRTTLLLIAFLVADWFVWINAFDFHRPAALFIVAALPFKVCSLVLLPVATWAQIKFPAPPVDSRAAKT